MKDTINWLTDIQDLNLEMREDKMDAWYGEAFKRVVDRQIQDNTVNLGFIMQKEKEMNTNWEFHSSADADIDWKDIKDSLTYREPLALITRKYKDYVEAETYVVVSKQLMDKANAISIEEIPDVIDTVAKRVFLIDNNFSEWVDWAKAVKAAKWPDGTKSTLKVVLPTI